MTKATCSWKETKIGLVPIDWDVVPLGKLLQNKIQNGAFKKRDQFGQGVPFLNVADTYKSHTVNTRTLERVQCSEDEVKKFGLWPGDLIFVRSSLKREGVGQCIVVDDIDEPTIFDCHLMRVRVQESKAVPPFLAFYSLSLQGKQELIARSKTTTMTTINQQGLSNFLVPLPPLPEQRRIARVLNAIQRSIAAQDNMIAAARELKRSLMQRLFTYGPGLQPAETKETEIGEIPAHWQVVKLGRLINDKIQNGAFKKREEFGEGAPFLNVADTYKSVVVQTYSLAQVQCTDNEMEKFGLEPNDLIFVRSSLKREGVGQCILVEELEEPTIFDCHLMRVKPDTSQVVPRFLVYYSLSEQGKDALIARSKTTTMTTINQSGLASFLVPQPPFPEQEIIAKTLGQVEQKIDVEEQCKFALQALFKSTLHQLMTGQIRLKDKDE